MDHTDHKVENRHELRDSSNKTNECSSYTQNSDKLICGKPWTSDYHDIILAQNHNTYKNLLFHQSPVFGGKTGCILTRGREIRVFRPVTFQTLIEGGFFGMPLPVSSLKSHALPTTSEIGRNANLREKLPFKKPLTRWKGKKSVVHLSSTFLDKR